MRNAAGLKERLFFFEDAVPRPDYDAGSRRCSNLLSLLAGRFDVSFIPRQTLCDRRHLELLHKAGVTLLAPEDGQWEAASPPPRYAVISRPQAGLHFLPRVRRAFGRRILTVYDTVDLYHLRIRSEMDRLTRERPEAADETKRMAAEYRQARAAEVMLIHEADQVWVLTAEEQQYLTQGGFAPSEKIEVIPNILDGHSTHTPHARRSDLLFIGGFRHRPNLHAIQYYLSTVVPELRRRDLRIRLRVVGSDSHLLGPIDTEGIDVVGFVEDPIPHFESSLCAFVPLFTGAGMKGKVTQALALGLPVVTTPIGAQGYERASEMMILGSNERELVDAVQRYQSDETLWQIHRERGLRYIETHLSPAAIRPRLMAAFGRERAGRLYDSHR